MLGPRLSLVIMPAVGNACIRASGDKKRASPSPHARDYLLQKEIGKG